MFFEKRRNFKLLIELCFKRSKTIYALSSGALPSAIAVLRISGKFYFEKTIKILFKFKGKQSENALKILTKKKDFKSRQIFYTNIFDEKDEILDKSMACFFKDMLF